MIKHKYHLHELRKRKHDSADEVDLNYTMFTSALQRLQIKHPEKYSFILKAGMSYKEVLFSLFKTIWSNEVIPAGWKKTEIVQLYKGKGDPHDLNNHRNIHTKVDTRKLFGEIVTHEVKNIISNVSQTMKL